MRGFSRGRSWINYLVEVVLKVASNVIYLMTMKPILGVQSHGSNDRLTAPTTVECYLYAVAGAITR